MLRALRRGWEDQLRVLGLRTTPEEFDRFGFGQFVVAFFVTWVVGMGRWWDDPTAGPLQLLGVGSVVYAFALGTGLYLVAKPLRPRKWRYWEVVTFIGMTALPGIIYAIPVERFLSSGVANVVNLSFLGVVAVWRIRLLLSYFRNRAGFSWAQTAVVALLPISAILVGVTVFGIERELVLSVGVSRSHPETADTGAVSLLGTAAIVVFVPVAIAYVHFAVRAAGVNFRSSRKPIRDFRRLIRGVADSRGGRTG